MTTHLFFDPGEHAGWAIFTNKKLSASGVVNGSQPPAIYALGQKIVRDYPDIDRHAIIEAGFIGINKHSSLRLAERRGMAHALLEVQGFKVEYLFVSEWQTILGKKEKGDSKKLSLELANRFLPAPIKNHNTSDAICQGLYYLDIPTKVT